MAKIAVTILEPGGERSAHLVENLQPVRDMLPPILEALRLPGEVTYQLIPVASAKPLREEVSLADAGIPAGAELHLKPVQNKILKFVLDQLYKQALNYAKRRMWKEAKERLETLLRLDPSYPDPLGLEEAIETNTVPTDPMESLQPGRGQTTAASTESTPATMQTVPASSRGQYRLEPQDAAKGAGRGCLRLAAIIVGVVVIGSVVFAGAVLYYGGSWPAPVPNQTDPQSERDDGILLGTGDVQITLRWDEPTDLDLHVIDPAQEEIWYGWPAAASGGELDVDANAACSDQLPLPVENIFWPTGGAPKGDYEVRVVYYTECDGSGSTDYEVTIKLDGQIVDVKSGQVTPQDDVQTVARFTYP